MRIERSVVVGCRPETAYDLVADVSGVGRLSEECVSARWTEGMPGTIGARFVGCNRVAGSTWEMECEVIAAERPHRFAWRVLTEAVTPDTSVWSYSFAPRQDGTLVTETFSMAEPPIGLKASLDRHDPGDAQLLLQWRHDRLAAGMEATLANLRMLAESPS